MKTTTTVGTAAVLAVTMQLLAPPIGAAFPLQVQGTTFVVKNPQPGGDATKRAIVVKAKGMVGPVFVSDPTVAGAALRTGRGVSRPGGPAGGYSPSASKSRVAIAAHEKCCAIAARLRSCKSFHSAASHSTSRKASPRRSVRP